VEDDRRARQRRTRRRRWRVRGGTAGARPLEGGDNQVFAQGQRRASHFTQLTSFSPRAASRSSSTTGGTQGIRSRVPPRPRPPLPPQRTRRQQLREAARGSLRPFFHGGTSSRLSGGRWRGGGVEGWRHEDEGGPASAQMWHAAGGRSAASFSRCWDDRRAQQRRMRRRRWRVRGGTAGACPLEGGDSQVFAQGQRRASHFTQLTSFSPCGSIIFSLFLPTPSDSFLPNFILFHS
jgi:hypothetical protein